ncbi:hypothetical protein F7R25_03880 [Burkholderia stagnalis]|uniref:Uncharacterized protein n=1 Tax=Burkholderia stagnalis TaxID=1503054 RepID=A0A6L3N3Z1_9BURK|nr:hypothetical protein [Burkholderia stagnalis]KAB0640644.1 hypothetical protein F7R25_03880 [Burkholderia stagnalis]VWB05911.1 hypothetical protein BST28156_00091 [Burkholderia stagnalis]
MRKTTIMENNQEEAYIDNWMKSQPKVVKGKVQDVKRSSFYHEAIALHAKYSLQENFAQVVEAEFKRLHEIIAKKDEEIDRLNFKLMATGDKS